jgi:3-deoxy-alpha-D-manno-octulosonate 8-oxidase
MFNSPKTLKEFTALPRFWRIDNPTEIVLSDDGIGRLFALIEERGKKNPFFVIDKALENQKPFARIFAQKNKFVFNASYSEVRTSDVDALVQVMRTEHPDCELIVGIGGGSTMDLAKATGICIANPLHAKDYQGYSMEMNRGTDVWVVPALNGTGAEITPIAVMRGPEKKLGINNILVEARLAVIDPQLSAGAPSFNRFYTMMDCYFHHYEISKSKTSKPDAILDSLDGLQLSREVLNCDLTEYDLNRAIKSTLASILGGTSSVGGRVGIPHAISYGLSNSAPFLPHSVAVTLSMLALEDIYPDGYADTLKFHEINHRDLPKAGTYGLTDSDIPKMVKTALGMEKLWQSCFGMDHWKEKATPEYIESIYHKIIDRK